MLSTYSRVDIVIIPEVPSAFLRGNLPYAFVLQVTLTAHAPNSSPTVLIISFFRSLENVLDVSLALLISPVLA